MRHEESPESRLLCPVDALALAPGNAPGAGSGILSCGRHEYPVVDGIPVLTRTRSAEAALARVKEGDEAGALAALIVPERPGAGEVLARVADKVLGTDAFRDQQRERRIAAFARRHGGPSFPTYREALGALLLDPPHPEPESFHYFINRPSDPTFVVAEAITSAVPEGGEILDVCCGAGHVTRLLARRAPISITALDEGFAGLWLAKRYIAPEAAFVCARADRPLPFATDAFDAVVCSDALHDTEEPRVLAREILRVLREPGTAFVIHLHNPAFEHPYPGRSPMAPEGYAAIFEGGAPRMFDEGAVLSRWLETGQVDLGAAAAPRALASARTVALLAGGTGPDRVHGPFPPRPQNLVLSPLYHAAKEADGTLLLTRHWPSDLYTREYPEAAAYLPESARLSPDESRALARNELAGEAEDLFRRRVILDLPGRYGAERPW